MPTLKLPKNLARELADITAPCAAFTEDEPEQGWNPAAYNITEVVENRDTGDEKRWTKIRELVIRTKDGALWLATYEQGLTESQFQYPFEDEGDEIEFTRVQPFVKSVLEYQPVE